MQREGYLRAQHLGEGGSDQGRDVIAYREIDTGEQLWYFQCKGYQTISAATLIKEVEKYNQLIIADPSAKPLGIVFVTNARVTAGARKKVRAFCGQHGYECEFWARTELDSLVKKHKDVIAEFFNMTAAKKGTRIKSKGSGNIIIHGDVHGDVTAATIDTGDSDAPDVKSVTPTLPCDRISIARLPVSGSDLFGRDAE